MRTKTQTLTTLAPSPHKPLPSRSVADLDFPAALRYVWAGWKQGEHVSLIGPTGAGKTFFKRYLLRRRSYITTFVTKNSDSELDRIHREEGFIVQRKEWDGSRGDLIALWPKVLKNQDPDDFQAMQRYYFRKAINDAFHQKGWTLDFDEVSYMCDFLHMDRTMRWLLQQGRSDKTTIVAATQRPAWIPRAFYSMPSWLVFWANQDGEDLKRISSLGGVDGKVLRREVSELRHREILIVHNRHPYERIRTIVRV
jgi:hypothetical protein